MTYHVYPVDDLKSHDTEHSDPALPMCDCGPRIIEDRGGRMVVHVAYDGREMVEQAEAIMAGRRVDGGSEYDDDSWMVGQR